MVDTTFLLGEMGSLELSFGLFVVFQTSSSCSRAALGVCECQGRKASHENLGLKQDNQYKHFNVVAYLCVRNKVCVCACVRALICMALLCDFKLIRERGQWVQIPSTVLGDGLFIYSSFLRLNCSCSSY